MGVRRCLQKLVVLLGYREPIGMASEALSTLVTDFGAMAGSIFYATRPPMSVRRGDLTPALTAHIDRWEAGVEQRISAGSWKLGGREDSTLATQAIKDTDYLVLYSLILNKGEVEGTICLIYRQGHLPVGQAYSVLVYFLRTLGRMLSMVGELSLMKERLGQLSLFYQVSQSMASNFDLGKVLSDTMQLATAVLDASASALMLINKDTEELVFEYTHGEMSDRLRKQRTDLDEGIAGWVATHGEPVVVNDVHSDSRFSPKVDARTGFLTHSVVCVPIQIRGQTIGVLEALNKRQATGFDAEDLSLMITTANQAAIAIENAQLYQSLRDERDRILQAQEDVRRQVARNLHDGTVQFLSAISMGIDHLERLLEFKPEAARSELVALRDLTRQATQQARLALFELRPVILETQGLGPALETYVQQLQGSEEFEVHLEAPNTLPTLNNSVSATVFAIVQEAVTNAKKHASPRDVWLRLLPEDGWLSIVVEDNGSGFDPERVNKTYDRKGSIGLLSMRERAELIEASLRVESCTESPDSGTRIILRIPVRSGPQGAVSASS
jgi:signal transduction histidine kinase